MIKKKKIYQLIDKIKQTTLGFLGSEEELSTQKTINFHGNSYDSFNVPHVLEYPENNEIICHTLNISNEQIITNLLNNQLILLNLVISQELELIKINSDAVNDSINYYLILRTALINRLYDNNKYNEIVEIFYKANRITQEQYEKLLLKIPILHEGD